MFPILLLLPLIIELTFAETSASNSIVIKPGCRDYICGNVTIPYPFGIGKECYMNDWFTIDCNRTSTPPKAVIQSISMEVLRIETERVFVKSPIIFSNCSGKNRSRVNLNLTSSPFYFSFSNSFNVFGCNTRALLTDMGSLVFGCDSICRYSNSTSSNWTGRQQNGTCQATIRYKLQNFRPELGVVDKATQQDSSGCTFAFLADQEWLVRHLPDPGELQSLDDVPVVLAWSWTPDDPYWTYDRNTTYCSFSIIDASTNYKLQVFECFCGDGYEGSPYLGCTDINECNDPKLHSCHGIMKCVNQEGSYKCEVNVLWIIILGVGVAIGVSSLAVLLWWGSNAVKARKKVEMKKKFFERNGGLLLQRQVSSSVGNTRIFTWEELEAATDGFSENRIVGQGGQGTVYKGMLEDGATVAVKKSKIVEGSKVHGFISEVAILSQINHRNVVKLLGCCLETELPLLVYEFIPNGNLFEYLHDPTEDFPLSWEVRLRIAAEVAGALSYLHSEASIPIYHRDIKSSNILLDGKYRAKESDFGISRWMNTDRTHLTTDVKGTFGYLDPEYFRSGQFTDKSDVYSFGVLLVELISGKKPILEAESQEIAASLAMLFIQVTEEDRICEFVDDKVKDDGHEQEVIAIAGLAKRCLHMSGKDRPTMREVTVELERVWLSRKGSSEGHDNRKGGSSMDQVFHPHGGDWVTHDFEFDGAGSTLSEVEPLFPTKTL